MSLKTKVSGTWKEISSPKVKVSGVWKDATKVYAKDNGSWHLVYQKTEPVEVDYLTFTPSSGTVSVRMPNCEEGFSYGWDATTKEYSIDGGTTWYTLDLSIEDTVTGPTIMLRGLGGTRTNSDPNICWQIEGTDVAVSGNIETVLDYQAVAAGNHPTLATNCYGNMFQYGGIKYASELIIPTTTSSCCNSMFQYNTTLVTAPELPTTLADGCYSNMFYGCTSLTTAPTLSATTLAESCYNGMFTGCTSLTIAPALPATTLANYCYGGMFNMCSSLTTAPTTLPAATLTDYCYSCMFMSCSSLTIPPTLPATSASAEGCYTMMFMECSSLQINNDGSSGTLFFTCPSVVGGATDMFLGTGGTYTRDPVAGGTYYYY